MPTTQLMPSALPGRPYGSFAGKIETLIIPGLSLLAPDRQDTWAPRWVHESVALPERYYATQDLAFPVTVGGDPFDTGESDVGGEDLVGGGAGSGDRPAHGNILNAITVTRRLFDHRGQQIDVPEFEVELSNSDGALQGDYTGTPGQLWRYDEVSRLVLPAAVGVVSTCHREPDRYRLVYTGFDTSIFFETIPKRLITLAEFPLAAPDAVGKPVPWVLGNVENLPIPCVRDDQVGSEFDYLLTVDEAAALTGLRRVMSGGGVPFVEITSDELEPYPGMDGYLRNGNLEGWDAGAAAAPDDWTLFGAAVTVAKNIVTAQVDEGKAAASITRAGTTGGLSQNLALNDLTLPLSYWQSREVTITMRARPSAGSQVRVRLDDGVGVFDSIVNLGTGAYETLTLGTAGVPVVTSATATQFLISARLIVDGTVQIDRVQVYLRARNFNECLRPDFYLGLTAIRFFLRQADPGGALYTIVADVHGNQPARNPIRAIATILEHPTAGLGRTVDPVTFAAMEDGICLTHEDAGNLDGPEFFLPLRDAVTSFTAQTVTVRDRSGHERHGTYDKGTSGFVALSAGYNINPAPTAGGSGTPFDNDGFLDNLSPANDGFITVPSAAAFSAPAISLRTTFQIEGGTLPDAALYPITEKLVGAATLSGSALYRENSLLKFAVRSDDTTLYTVTSPLVAVTDEDRWIDAWGTAEAGVLRLYRDGVLAATGSYSGALAEGEGDVLTAKFGTGSAAVGHDMYDNITLYSHAVSAARIAAVYAALPLDAEAVGYFDREIAIKSPTFSYRLSEAMGVTTIADSSGNGHTGAWVGGPTLGVPGPLTAERGHVNSYSQARFENDVSKYGVETGMTLADAAFTIDLWYTPSYLKAPSGLCEKTIGTGAAALRDTQWGFCQRPAFSSIRFTLIHAGGTTTLDVPMLAADVGREMWLVATVEAGVCSVYKNGGLAVTGTYTAPVASGVGDFLIGVNGTNGVVRTRPCQGDLGRISYHPSAFTAADVARIYLAAVWYNGGLCVDMALTEPRQAQDVLRQICLFRGIRFGVTPEGAITVAADLAAPTTIRLEARDGPGDGELTLIDLRGRTRPPKVKDVVVRGARDLLSGAWGVERRRAVHAQGLDDLVELDVARALPTLDRIASYRRARLALDETVTGRLTQEARQLREGELVQVTHAHAGYAGDVLEARAVTWGLEETGCVLGEWDEDIYLWVPEPYPVSAG